MPSTHLLLPYLEVLSVPHPDPVRACGLYRGRARSPATIRYRASRPPPYRLRPRRLSRRQPTATLSPSPMPSADCLRCCLPPRLCCLQRQGLRCSLL